MASEAHCENPGGMFDHPRHQRVRSRDPLLDLLLHVSLERADEPLDQLHGVLYGSTVLGIVAGRVRFTRLIHDVHFYAAKGFSHQRDYGAFIVALQRHSRVSQPQDVSLQFFNGVSVAPHALTWHRVGTHGPTQRVFDH